MIENLIDINNETLKRDMYNFFNLLVFFILYVFVIIYQYALNEPTSYFISMAVDICFSIYLISYTQILFSNYDTTISIILSGLCHHLLVLIMVLKEMHLLHLVDGRKIHTNLA